MNHDELNKFHETICKKARDLLKVKNHDYASKKNALKNIIDAADNCGISPVVGCWNRSCDKFSRISNFIKNGIFKVEDEKLEDTIYDLINYTIFVLALCNESKEHDYNYWEKFIGDENSGKPLIRKTTKYDEFNTTDED